MRTVGTIYIHVTVKLLCMGSVSILVLLCFIDNPVSTLYCNTQLGDITERCTSLLPRPERVAVNQYYYIKLLSGNRVLYNLHPADCFVTLVVRYTAFIQQYERPHVNNLCNESLSTHNMHPM